MVWNLKSYSTTQFDITTPSLTDIDFWSLSCISKHTLSQSFKLKFLIKVPVLQDCSFLKIVADINWQEFTNSIAYRTLDSSTVSKIAFCRLSVCYTIASKLFHIHVSKSLCGYQINQVGGRVTCRQGVICALPSRLLWS